MQGQKVLKIFVKVNVKLLVRRCVQVQGIVALAEDVFVVLKHDLAVSVWMEQRNDVQVMHLS
jgi:hypothetical protein